MTLYEFGKMTDCEVKVELNFEGQWYATISRLEIKKGDCLVGPMCVGDSPNDAVAELCCEISGKHLVVNAYDRANRREFRDLTVVP